MAVNKVILVGNLGRDPETRTTASGLTIANLNIATTERRKDQQSGEWADHTEWHRVTVFGKRAETVARFLTKGRQVYIEGKLRTSKYQAKDGTDRWSTEVVADEVKFIGGRGEGGQQGGPSSGSGGYSGGSGGGSGGGYNQGPGGHNGNDGDSIPF